MREREEEIRNIHKGMHQVNEIYKVWGTFHELVLCRNSALLFPDLLHTFHPGPGAFSWQPTGGDRSNRNTNGKCKREYSYRIETYWEGKCTSTIAMCYFLNLFCPSTKITKCNNIFCGKFCLLALISNVTIFIWYHVSWGQKLFDLVQDLVS